MSIITMPKPSRDRLGDEAMESFAVLLKEVGFEGGKDALAISEERFERRLSMSKLGMRWCVLENTLDKRLAISIEEIAKTNLDRIAWVFIVWASHISVIVALFALLR